MIEHRLEKFFSDRRNRRKYDIALVYLFGSAIDGRFGPRSDLDLGVLFKNHDHPREILTKSALLQIDLARYLAHPVDLAILNFASPILQHGVLRGKRIYAIHKASQEEFEEATHSAYKKFSKALDRKFKP